MSSRCAESVRYKVVMEEEMRRKDNERRAGKVGGVEGVFTLTGPWTHDVTLHKMTQNCTS